MADNSYLFYFQTVGNVKLILCFCWSEIILCDFDCKQIVTYFNVDVKIILLPLSLKRTLILVYAFEEETFSFPTL